MRSPRHEKHFDKVEILAYRDERVDRIRESVDRLETFIKGESDPVVMSGTFTPNCGCPIRHEWLNRGQETMRKAGW